MGGGIFLVNFNDYSLSTKAPYYSYGLLACGTPFIVSLYKFSEKKISYNLKNYFSVLFILCKKNFIHFFF